VENSSAQKSHFELSGETFERLLRWLAPDRDQAAIKYEEIRRRLTTIFISRGCVCSEELADKTIDRVAVLIGDLSEKYHGDPAPYFYGVAKKIYLEYQRKKPLEIPPSPGDEQELELRYECLERCLGILTQGNRELIVSYYRPVKDGKDYHTGELAARFGMDSNALWVRVHRIRKKLHRCVSECFFRTKRT
jgi:DNA-directed RNA polymerase specialized sigma24 family protein